MTGGDDPYDDDVVLKKLFHRNLKLLIVTEGSKGCRYYTKVCLPYQFEYDVTRLVGCIISDFIFGLFYAAVCTCVHRQSTETMSLNMSLPHQISNNLRKCK